MTMRMRVGAVEHVFIEFTDDIDPESLADCRDAYDRIPSIRWKNVTVVLHRIDGVNSAARALLRHVQSRAGACEFFLVNCGPEISKNFQYAPATPDAVSAGEARLIDEGPRRLVQDLAIDDGQAVGALQLQ